MDKYYLKIDSYYLLFDIKYRYVSRYNEIQYASLYQTRLLLSIVKKEHLKKHKFTICKRNTM